MNIEYLRSFKVYGMAAFDWILTLIVVIITIYFMGYKLTLFNVGKGMIGATLLAILVHAAIGQKTALNTYIGISR